jgi:hypothetical protein
VFEAEADFASDCSEHGISKAYLGRELLAQSLVFEATSKEAKNEIRKLKPGCQNWSKNPKSEADL